MPTGSLLDRRRMNDHFSQAPSWGRAKSSGDKASDILVLDGKGRTKLKSHRPGPVRANRAAVSAKSVAFPIVGVGASAGGLEAFTQLLKHLPADTGSGFVLVQHLDPAHESALTHLLSRATAMPVVEVTNNLRVKRDHVYVIPPNVTMSIARGVLKLSARSKTVGPHRSIDFFLESLAADQHERSVGVILSGTATDGTLGLEAIKAENGITFAQDDSAKFDSMPRSAVAGGCVDFVLSPKRIANELARIARHPSAGRLFRKSASALRAGKPRGNGRSPIPQVPLDASGQKVPRVQAKSKRSGSPVNEPAGFKEILLLLRGHRGVDFSLYKSSTISRRVARRMVMSTQNTLDQYAAFLKGNAKELDALYADVLIGVTGFFRNPDAFEVLKRRVIPKLIAQAHSGEPLRMWVLGCSTGQEAYSIAMAYAEASEKSLRAPKLQVFATDVNEECLDKARRGLYATALTAGLSSAQLRRFFTEEAGGYRVNKHLREIVIFARQNLIGDPPFSRMDLVSCRNLLIYLDPPLQQRSLATFHYALKPEGFLFLGASESVGPASVFFEVVDKKQKIFRRKTGPTPGHHRSHFPTHGETGAESILRPLLKLAPPPTGFRDEVSIQREADRIVLSKWAPPSVLIDGDLQVLQFRGDTSPYLNPPVGKASFDLLKMAREELVLPLRAVINQAKKANKPVRRDKIPLLRNGNAHVLNVVVTPLKSAGMRGFLVLFDEVPTGGRRAIAKPLPELDRGSGVGIKKPELRRIAALERELAETRDYLRSLQRDHETATEEMQAQSEEVQSSSEEMQAQSEEVQSANEELQSVNEEMETSKEELESTNEELTTVNEEMAKRNAELNRLNADLNNLQASTHAAVLLLGHDLTIRRFTPLAEKPFNLLATDLGRPLSAIKHNLEILHLDRFVAKAVQSRMHPDREVRDKDGRWYLLRIRPYLTLDSKPEGAVLVLVDIDALKRSEQASKAARDYAEAIVRTNRNPLVVLGPDLRVNTANEAFYKAFKLDPAEVEGHVIFDLSNGFWTVPKLREFLQDILPRNSFFNDCEVTLKIPEQAQRTMLLDARRLDDGADTTRMILVAIEDVTERLESRAAMKRSEIRYRRLFETAPDGVLMLDPDSRKITDANPFILEFLGYRKDELLGKELWEIGLLKDEHASQEAFRELQEKGFIRYENLPLESKGGEKREVEFVSSLYDESGHKVIQCNIRDVTVRKVTEAALREAKDRLGNRAGELELLVAERTEKLRKTIGELEAFSYSLTHDLRAPLRTMGSFARILAEECGESVNAQGKDCIRRIVTSAERMDKLVTDVLNYSVVIQSELTLAPVDTDKLLRGILESYPAFQPPGTEIIVEGRIPPVMGSEAALAQCISNLLANAIKFVAPGTVPKVRIWVEMRGDRVRLFFQDVGIGIEKESQEKIFGIFQRLSRGYEGTGIGLAIVKKAVERMGGSVGLDSQPGKGSTFWLDLAGAPGGTL
jgi:two-component system CheB/CheR fusion protein